MVWHTWKSCSRVSFGDHQVWPTKARLNRLPQVWHPCRYLFFTFLGGFGTVGSKSGVSTVTSYSLNNGGAMIFLPKNSIMNIQTLSPAFDVIHTLIALIELYKNYMTFWENARFFPNWGVQWCHFFGTEGVLGYLVIRVLCYLLYVTSTHTWTEVFSLDTFVQKNMMRFFAYKYIRTKPYMFVCFITMTIQLLHFPIAT